MIGLTTYAAPFSIEERMPFDWPDTHWAVSFMYTVLGGKIAAPYGALSICS